MIVRTPTDMKMLRKNLGLSIDEAAELFDCLPQSVVSHEKGKSKFIYPRWIERLNDLWNQTRSLADDLADVPQRYVREGLIVIYSTRSDRAFQEHERLWAPQLIYPNVYAQTISAFNLWKRKGWTLVEFNEEDYKASGHTDKLAWAQDYVKRYSNFIPRESVKTP